MFPDKIDFFPILQNTVRYSIDIITKMKIQHNLFFKNTHFQEYEKKTRIFPSFPGHTLNLRTFLSFQGPPERLTDGSQRI